MDTEFHLKGKRALRTKQITSDIFYLLLGSFLFALAINLFIIPSDLGEGGVTGVAIILYYVYEWSPAVVSLALNACLVVLGYTLLDKKTMLYTIICVIAHSFFLNMTHNWTLGTENMLVNIICGGAFAGAGIGLVIRAGGTTAGSVILARIVHKFFGWNISYALLFLDVIVVLASYFVIGADNMFLTVIMLYVGTKVMEYIIEGWNSQKAVTVITSKPDDIASQVNKHMARGVTVLSGYGYYTKNKKEILYIVVNRREVLNIKKIVQETDDKAFVTIHDVRDVFGTGFLDISKS